MNKSIFIWNSIAGIINASEAVIMSILVTRVTSLSDAGVLTIAFAVGNLMMTLGKFGVRNYQVTDTHYKYDFATYFGTRIVTVIAMVLGSVGYILHHHMSAYKSKAIFAICLIYAVESVEDVFWGEFQRRKRLDLGAKVFISRWVCILCIFTIILLKTRNMLFALWISLVVSIFIFCGILVFIWRGFNKISSEPFYLHYGLFANRDFIFVLRENVPLFIATFLTFYINNAAKYALDTVVSNEVQACYGFVAMPVFVIGLLNSMIYQPSVVWLTEQWNEGRILAFKYKVYKQFMAIIVISILCVVGAAIIGIPVLSIVYGTELRAYWRELVLLQVAGMFLAISGYLNILITIMRQQRMLMYGYIIVSVLSFFCMRFAVRFYTTFGAAICYLMCMITLCVFFITVYLRNVFKRELRLFP